MASDDRTDEGALVAALRAGDEGAFAEVVRRYHASMVRVASAYVPTRAVAEEVAQDTWVAVLRGLGRFEGRSSFRTWLFSILVNRAKTAGSKEPRSLSFDGPDRPEDEHFSGGAWTTAPGPWPEDVVERLAAPALADVARRSIEDLPPGQREVVTLRDVEGLSSDEVCELLGISQANQRVLLHRGRTKVRMVLDRQLGEV